MSQRRSMQAYMQGPASLQEQTSHLLSCRLQRLNALQQWAVPANGAPLRPLADQLLSLIGGLQGAGDLGQPSEWCTEGPR